MKTKFVAALCAAGLLLASCRKDDVLSKPGQDAGNAGSRSQVEIAFPGEKGIPKEVTINGSPLHYYDFHGHAIFEGDILLTNEQLAGRTIDNDRGCGMTSMANRWPNGIVYYTIDGGLPLPSRVDTAILNWVMNSNIKFIPRTTQTNYITFFYSASGTYSNLGMIGGQQGIYVANWATGGNIAHEIGHALGLFHEQSRTDRGSSIIIHTANIQPAAVQNFYTYTALGYGGFNYMPFDFESIMLYDSYAFSQNGQPTITRLNGSTFSTQRTYLSQSDILTINYMYPLPAEELYIVENSRLYAVDNTTGAYENVGPPAWANTNTITTLNGYVYLIDGASLYRVDKNIGIRTIIGNAVWSNANAMTNYNGWIYIVQNSRLYKVDATTGTYTQLGGVSWPNTLGMCESGGFLYLIQNSRLYKVDPNTGSYVQVGGAVWGGSEAIASGFAAGYIHIVQNSRLYKVDISTGTYAQLGGAVWAGTEGMTHYGGWLYIVENSRLYRVDGNTGSYTQLGNPVWANTAGIASM